jgi:kynureninase
MALEIITPKLNHERGCQLSIIAHGLGKDLHTKLTENGVITDWREPNVIRMAPTPLYNSFVDLFRLGTVLKQII